MFHRIQISRPAVFSPPLGIRISQFHTPAPVSYFAFLPFLFRLSAVWHMPLILGSIPSPDPPNIFSPMSYCIVQRQFHTVSSIPDRKSAAGTSMIRHAQQYPIIYGNGHDIAAAKNPRYNRGFCMISGVFYFAASLQPKTLSTFCITTSLTAARPSPRYCRGSK